jgi:hypothetical protein
MRRMFCIATLSRLGMPKMGTCTGRAGSVFSYRRGYKEIMVGGEGGGGGASHAPRTPGLAMWTARMVLDDRAHSASSIVLSAGLHSCTVHLNSDAICIRNIRS